MKSNDIRNKFVEYFESKSHTLVKSSNLIPKGDDTLLFTNAGMNQFKDVFTGTEKRDYTRAVTVQKCMRAGGKHNDLENVGYTPRHHTFFEMLGNFSFGDYFKEEAIEFGWEFLTKVMELPTEHLYVSVYKDDKEAYKIWHEKIGLDKKKIVKLGDADNFWSMGDTGPCGPCSEIHIDQGKDFCDCTNKKCNVGCDCGRYLEIWNLVFMQYFRDEKGKLTPLPNPSIDTGMGLERLSAVKQNVLSNYDTDIFKPIIKEIEKISKKKYGNLEEDDISIRAISDHVRAITFLIADGVLPSNEGRGYVLRRILRRAARHGRFISIKKSFLFNLCRTVIDELSATYPEIERARKTIVEAVKSEEERFLQTLEKGLQILDDEIQELKKSNKKTLSGKFAFKLYDTFGFPLDLTEDIIKNEDIKIDIKTFEKEMKTQQETARASWAGSGEKADTDEIAKQLKKDLKTNFQGYDKTAIDTTVTHIIKDLKLVKKADRGDTVSFITKETVFYGESGGQVGDKGVATGDDVHIFISDTKKINPDLTLHIGKITDGTLEEGTELTLEVDKDKRQKITANHSATHILHSILRTVLGDHVRQAGSLVTPDYLRFDFNHFSSIDRQTLKILEEKINKVIRDDYKLSKEEMTYDEAIKKGALAFFDEKYGDKVRTVKIGKVSMELCGGTHVDTTGEIGILKFLSEGSVAAGVRRVEAVTGTTALEEFNRAENTLNDIAETLKTSPHDTLDKVKKLLKENKALQKDLDKVKSGSTNDLAKDMAKSAKDINGVKVVSANIENSDSKGLREASDMLKNQLKSCILVLCTIQKGKVALIVTVTKDLSMKYNAGNIIKELSPIIGGRGGGKAEMAQAGGDKTDKVKDLIKKSYEIIESI